MMYISNITEKEATNKLIKLWYKSCYTGVKRFELSRVCTLTPCRLVQTASLYAYFRLVTLVHIAHVARCGVCGGGGDGG
jgi:hypothetical protein